MRVGRPAANLYNLRVQSTARTAAQLIATSRDPPQTLGLFLGTLAAGLRPAPPTPAPSAPRLPQPAARSSKK